MSSTIKIRTRLVPYGIIPLTLLLLIGCTPSTTGNPGGASNAIIDWVNFVQFEGITYLVSDQQMGQALKSDDVGSVSGTITHKLEGNVQDANYHAQDGDAAFLAVGTKVYRLKHYASTFRLVAYVQGKIQLYEADTNLHAKRGADLLDIADKVQSIDINNPNDGVTVLATIHDRQHIMSLVTMIMRASVNQQMKSNGTRYFLVFHLMDGTVVSRAFWPTTGELSRGILLPNAFAVAIEQVIQHHV